MARRENGAHENEAVRASADAVATNVACEPASEPAKQSASGGCCARHKNTPRTQEMQADLMRRLNRAIGQLNGVKGMIEDNRYCGDVLVQLAAAKSAVRSIERIVLENHLQTCVVEEIRDGNDEIITETMDLIRRVAK